MWTRFAFAVDAAYRLALALLFIGIPCGICGFISTIDWRRDPTEGGRYVVIPGSPPVPKFRDLNWRAEQIFNLNVTDEYAPRTCGAVCKE